MEGSLPERKQLALVFSCEASGEPPAQLYSDEREHSLQIRGGRDNQGLTGEQEEHRPSLLLLRLQGFLCGFSTYQLKGLQLMLFCGRRSSVGYEEGWNQGI